MRKKGGEDAIRSKPIDENLVFVMFVTMLMVFASGALPVGDEDNSTLPHNPCHKISGEVVLKEIEGEQHYLYVELYIDDADVEGYQVSVGEVTYDSYEIGDIYEQITCDVGWFNMFKDTIEHMLDAGLLEQF
jgi:hypothetical protein